MNRCGTCEHGKIISQDLKIRVCKGAPPQIVPVMTQKGPGTQNMYPLVNATDEGCGMYKDKLVIDTPDTTLVE